MRYVWASFRGDHDREFHANTVDEFRARSGDALRDSIASTSPLDGAHALTESKTRMLQAIVSGERVNFDPHVWAIWRYGGFYHHHKDFIECSDNGFRYLYVSPDDTWADYVFPLTVYCVGQRLGLYDTLVMDAAKEAMEQALSAVLTKAEN